jgi:iron(III) transport system substrate-binding protein
VRRFIFLLSLFSCWLGPAVATSAATLTVYTSDPASLANDLAKGFQQETGTQVRVYAATTGQALARVQAEEGRPQADVVILADWTAGLELQNQGLVFAYRPAAILRQLVPGFAPPGDFLPIGCDTVSIAVNSSVVSGRDMPHDWFDLTRAQWNGKVSMPDPSLSGTSSDFVLAFINQYGARGWDYFKALKANGTIWPGPNAAALSPVSAGARWALLAGVGHTALEAKANNNTIDLVFPSSGTILIPRPIVIMKSTPDKALAQRFVDYALSATGQRMVAKSLLIPALSSVPASPMWPDLRHIRFIHEDWNALVKTRENVLKRFATDIMGQ